MYFNSLCFDEEKCKPIVIYEKLKYQDIYRKFIKLLLDKGFF